MNFFLIGGKNESFCEYSFSNLCFGIAPCRCEIGTYNPDDCQPGNHCRRFGGAYSLLSFLEVNYVGYFVFYLGLGDGRLWCSCDYPARRSAGLFD